MIHQPMQLFAFPHAGGGSSVFRDWPAVFKPEFEVIPVCPPGRDSRFSEDLGSDLVSIAELLAREIMPQLRSPYVLYGHSMGAYLAMETAAWLSANGSADPVALIVAASTGHPDVGSRIAPFDPNASHEELLARAESLDGFDPRVLMNKHLVALLAPILANDLAMCSRYRSTVDRLRIPILAIAARDDRAMPIEEVLAWNERTSADSDIIVIPGDHFVHQRDPGAVLDAIHRSRLITRWL